MISQENLAEESMMKITVKTNFNAFTSRGIQYSHVDSFWGDFSVTIL